MENSKIEIPMPKYPDNYLSQFENFVDIVKILRKECPWDRKQTNETIANLLVEETYEAIDAIYSKKDKEFAKELGDILLHIVMHSIIAEERGGFSLLDVIREISTKMINRHPHVFNSITVKDETEVMQNWEQIKLKEKENEGKDISSRSTLSGVPRSLPALLRAERIQHKVSRVGFDWDNKDDVWQKIEEELQEFRAELSNNDKEKARQELGDFIFAIVNAARHEGLVAEESLHLTNNKFSLRFQFIEQKSLEAGKKLNDMTLSEMDALWEKSKEIFI
ncbi:MAG TPA: nucleoside triphosphate pyrophosphohydrolase [Candidatus Kapabacteria bacterium]|nr:nucleoside triphosphate pyrophosphohydrolase [Candidatus Kapabacteria bacterium]